ncbi:MAG: hypothetical protein KDC39_09905 [Actinobacteria bacterium]|nr:hypothetical protein [Actinomycetota bacterium]
MDTVALQGRYRMPSPNVISDTVDGEAIAIRLDTGAYYSFSAAGTVCWNLVRAGVVPQRLVDVLAADENELAAFVASLVKDELLEQSHMEPREVLLDGTLDLSGQGAIGYERHEEMTDIFAFDPIHDVDPESGWPTSTAEPHRDAGIRE